MEDVSFFYYPADVHIPTPLGRVSFQQFLKANKYPKGEIISLFEQIDEATKKGDLDLKRKLKSKLFYFTPCVETDGIGRSYSNIKGFTGLMVLDFDKLPDAPAFKQFLFDNLKCVVAAYLSPSKKGCKFIVKIPKCQTIDEFKSYFYGLGFYMEKYEGFDPSTQNCILPLYLSIDSDLLYRENADIWTEKGYKLDEFKVFDGEIEVLENISDKDKNRIKLILTKSIEKIVDSGHYIVRSTALCAGGYVASGYYTQEEAEEILFYLIENNDYCKKNLRGYKQTAKDMIIKGMKSPLYLKND
jgi:hypothetical protein